LNSTLFIGKKCNGIWGVFFSCYVKKTSQTHWARTLTKLLRGFIFVYIVCITIRHQVV
jgi:hypothetical protein